MARSLFDEILTASKTPVISLKSIYGISALRDVTSTTGTGSITNSAGEYHLTVSAASDSATLDSAERGRYQAGQAAQAGIGVRLPTLPTGSQVARWGYFDDNDGYGFGVDASGVFCFRRSGGTTAKVYQEKWIGDHLNGRDASGLTLDLSSGYIWQVDFSWYGFGVIEYQLVTFTDEGRRQQVIALHRERVVGSVSTEDPNLPLRAELDNSGDDRALEMHVGGRQFSILGRFAPNRRVTSQSRLTQDSSETFRPAVTFRRKTAFESVSVKTAGVSVLSDTQLILQLRLNGSLSGGSGYQTPDDHSAAETALEVDKTATGITGGEVLWQELVQASGSGSNQSGGLQASLPRLDYIGQQPVTLCHRTVSGTSTGGVTTLLEAEEEW